ncbi:PRC-barrel domain-containing protein [Caulobacter endophyticus]|uniref:PRC-barrel domain-containing protein n=1 Tax=Caulobacter endophyticus TaxID=2172652 RepID=UPI002410334D|nr:PRC-barrel domain-containing protein [Caulobacter endophyticus]MDG2530636.1 PRC-barrel domain-containing protein [Caulobacter endophyticus]
MKRIALTAVAFALVGGAAFAQSTIARDETLSAKGSFTVGQIEDADVIDSANKKAGEVEHVLLDAAGKPTAVVIEIDRVGPDKKVVVALADVSVAPEPGDPNDYLVRTKLTKDQLANLPDWKP